MSIITKTFAIALTLVVLVVLTFTVFSGYIFRSFLRSAFIDIGNEKKLQVSFSDASLGVSGKVAINSLDVVDLESQSNFFSVKQIEARFGWLSLLSSPRVIDSLVFHEPVLTWVPGISRLFQSGEQEETQQESTNTSSEAYLRLLNGQVLDGKIRVQEAGQDPRVILTQLNATVSDVSQNDPISFDLKAGLTGETSGTIGLKGQFNPSNMDGNLTIDLVDISNRSKTSPWPMTQGKISVVLENNLSRILSSGKVDMQKAPPAIPEEISAGTPFGLVWKVESLYEKEGSGKIDLRTFEIAIQGLKGGPQTVSGNGVYDPATSKGEIKVAGQQISSPLLNPLIEPSLGMRILEGKADLNLNLVRNGEDSPFLINGNLAMAGLSLKDMTGKRSGLQFKNIALNTNSEYAPKSDSLTIKDLSLNLDDIQLGLNGKVASMQDAKKRELDLSIRQGDVDVGRLVALAAPDFSRNTGTLSGRAGIDLSIKGVVSSPKFPVLNGKVDLKGVSLVPVAKPEMPVSVKGLVNFDSDVIQGENLAVNLASVPGIVSFVVKGYNEPRKQLQINAKGVAIDPLMQIYKPEAAGIITGKADAVIKATQGKGSRPESLEITYKITDGYFRSNHPISKTIAELIGWKWLMEYKLTDARGKIVQTDRGYQLDPILFMGEKGGIAIQGWVGFDNKLTATARVNIAKANVEEVPGTIRKLLRAKEESNYAFLDIPMAGTISRPLPDLKMDVLLDQGMSILEGQLKGKTGDKIREKLGTQGGQAVDDAANLLRGLFDK